MLVNPFTSNPSFQLTASSRSRSEPLNSKTKDPAPGAEKKTASSDSQSLENSIQQQRQLQALKSIDRQVRAHELAHLTVGGSYVTSGARFQYERGPDGLQYAVAGEVSISTSEIPGDPQETLRKAGVVLKAALAPVNPSAQDRLVAAKAISMIQQARAGIILQSQAGFGTHLGNQLDTFV